ncbi:uncharacterized protein LOC133422322 [Cololabis saira]|uniref:uncharacterized protein LOC133422322 n=1 Tax=Cololabis saira TaxID=129043 RepID=UPI002AD5ACEF|nr:uncharacterized protein LOC133422322 [Cololabis saira]
MKTCVLLALFLMAGVSLGDIQKRIEEGGRPCTADETKSFVFITRCSGTVIGDGNWVITTKHCEGDGGKYDIEDVNLNLKVTSKKTFPHNTADIMLIKGKTGMPGMPLVSEDDCSQVMDLIYINPVKMVISARDTKVKKTTGTDASMCADINVKGWTTEKAQLKKPMQKVLTWTPLACDSCDGDSGAGIIYNNALFAVHSGAGEHYGQDKIMYSGYVVCDGKIRKWIVKTMKDNP